MKSDDEQELIINIPLAIIYFFVLISTNFLNIFNFFNLALQDLLN